MLTGLAWIGGSIGLVTIENHEGRKKAFIKPILQSLTEYLDMMDVANQGHEFDLEIAQLYIDKHGQKAPFLPKKDE